MFFFVPSSKKSELIQLSRKHPELMQRALLMEDRALASGRWQVAGLGRHFSWRAFIESENQSAFPEAPVESCSICLDESEE